MFNVEYYETVNGKCLTKEFLDNLHPGTELPYVMNAIRRLEELGNNLIRPQMGHLRDGIYELRIRTINRQIRLLYFFYHQEAIIVSHGLIKKTEKVPDYEIKRAIDNKKDYLSRQKRMK